MRSKVTNENTWETKWTTESSQGGRGVRRGAKRTESSSGLKLSKPSRGNTAREKTLRRLESNERERMRMHSLNDAFQVCKYNILYTGKISYKKIMVEYIILKAERIFYSCL